MKKLAGLVFLILTLCASAQQAPPTGFVNPVSWTATAPNGTNALLRTDASGNLYTTGSPGMIQGPSGYIEPMAPVAINPSGGWSFLHSDANGNLMISGGGTSQVGTGPPTNPCPTQGNSYFDNNTNLEWYCPVNGGTWTQLAGSGTGTVQSGGGYALGAYGNATLTTIGPANITTDATGNNLTVPGTGSFSSGTASLISGPCQSSTSVTVPAGANFVIFCGSDNLWHFQLSVGLGGANTTFEPSLGNPASNGYVLSSTTAGVRSWVVQTTGGNTTSSGMVNGNFPKATGTNTLTDSGIAITAVPTSVSNDTNVSGSISANMFSLGWTGTLAKSRNLASAVYNDQTNTFSAGLKQVFTANGTNAGLNLATVTADPSALAGGDEWMRSDLKRISWYDGATTQRGAQTSDFASQGTQYATSMLFGVGSSNNAGQTTTIAYAVGDSHFAGVTGLPEMILGPMGRHLKGYGDGGPGIFPLCAAGVCNKHPAPVDITTTPSGGWVYHDLSTSTPGMGLDETDALCASASTCTWTFSFIAKTSGTFTMPWEKLTGHGTFTWAIDGGSPTTINTATGGTGTPAFGSTAINYTAGNHTILITPTNGSGDVQIMPPWAISSQGGLVIINGGLGSERLDMRNAQFSVYNAVITSEIQALAPNIIIVGDESANACAAGIALATHATQLHTLYTNLTGAVTNNPTIALATEPDNSACTTFPSGSYSQNTYQEQLADHAQMFDFYAYMPSYVAGETGCGGGDCYFDTPPTYTHLKANMGEDVGMWAASQFTPLIARVAGGNSTISLKNSGISFSAGQSGLTSPKQYFTATRSGGSGTMKLASHTSDLATRVAVCVANCAGTSGSGEAEFTEAGVVKVTFSNTTTIGHYVLEDVTTDGELADTGSSSPPSAPGSGCEWVVGQVTAPGPSGGGLGYIDLGTGGYLLCASSGSSGANAALSNLSAVAINTTLLPATAGSANLGTALLPFGDVFIGSTASQAVNFNTAALTTNRTITFPDAAVVPVQPLGSAPAGGCVGYIDSNGVQQGASCSGSGGAGYSWTPATHTPPYTILAADFSTTTSFGKQLTDSSIGSGTYTLPSSSLLPASGSYVRVYNSNVGTLTLAAGSGTALQGTSCTTFTQYQGAEVWWDGANYRCFPWNASGSSGANTALSNLSAVAINTTLLPATAASANLGTALLPFGDIFIGDSASKALDVDVSALTANRTMTFPDAAVVPVQPLSSAPAGGCVGYIDSNGVQQGTACGGGSSAGATNDIQLAGAGGTFVADSGNFTENPTTHLLNVLGGITTGATPPAGCTSTGCFAMAEQSGTITPTAGVDIFAADSTCHGLKVSFNGGAAACWGAGVSSFNTRTGAVSPASGDYTAAQVTNAADVTAANTYSGGGLQDFSAMLLKLPIGASLTETVNGRIGYDSSNNNYHVAVNGADAVMATVPTATPVNTHCANWTVTAGLIQLGDAGAGCGSGSGGGGISVYSRESILLSGTSYFAVGGAVNPNATEANVQTASAAAATISNLTIQMGATPVSGNIVFTVRKCTPSSGACTGTDQTLTCTITNPAVSCTDSSHSFNAAKGDLLSIKAVVSSTAATTDLTAQLAIGTSGVGIVSVNGDTTSAQLIANGSHGGMTVSTSGGTTSLSITPVTSYRFGEGSNATVLLAVNNYIRAWAINLPVPVTFSGISLVPSVADGSGDYSVGIMDTTGHALCHVTSSQHWTTAGTIQRWACSEGTITLSGVVILYATGDATAAKVNTGLVESPVELYYSAAASGCSSSSGLINFSTPCTLGFPTPAVATVGIPNFLLD